MKSTILVGVDGSDHAQRAVEWCAAHAAAFDADVVAVHVIDTPVQLGGAAPYVWVNAPTPQQRHDLADRAEREWCKPFADAGVPFRVVLMDGRPAESIMQAAHTEDAALVVTGRRGLGGFKEMLLGSTSHQLSHLLDRPLVIVPDTGE
jgi:nucleotide-binding universal stress UspA family protein